MHIIQNSDTDSPMPEEVDTCPCIEDMSTSSVSEPMIGYVVACNLLLGRVDHLRSPSSLPKVDFVPWLYRTTIPGFQAGLCWQIRSRLKLLSLQLGSGRPMISCLGRAGLGLVVCCSRTSLVLFCRCPQATDLLSLVLLIRDIGSATGTALV